MVEETVNDGKVNHKFLTPLYVPLNRVESYLQKDKHSLELALIKNIYPNN